MLELESRILDSFQRTGVYIIQPGTYEVLYYNKMMKRTFPKITTGQPCYQFAGLSGPCAHCPIQNLDPKTLTGSSIITNEALDSRFDVTATQMEWETGTVYVIGTNHHISTREELRQQKTEQRLSTVLSRACDMVTEINMETGFFEHTDFSKKAFLLLDSSGNFRDLFQGFVERYVDPQQRREVLDLFSFEQLQRAFTTSGCLESPAVQYRLLLSNKEIWAESHAIYLKNETPPCTFILTKDVTPQRRMQALTLRNHDLERQRADDERYRIILQQTQTIVAEFCREKGKRYLSPLLMESLSGTYDDRELLDIWISDGVIHPDDIQSLRAFFRDVDKKDDICSKIILRFHTKAGAWRWYKLIASKMTDADSGAMRIIITMNDVHAETESQRSLRYRAEYDTLTGAYNKETFYQKTAELLHENSSGYCIVRLDIDRFKVVNDLFGTQKGDLLLCYMADCIRHEIHPRESFGRISGDIFCMCLSRSREEVVLLVTSLLQQMERYPLSFKITPSFGIYEVENRDTPVDIMCDWANLALKTVKGSYLSRYAFYDDNMRMNLLREQKIITEMHDAIRTGQFVIYLQPKYNIRSSAITGSEALVRWNHPKNGMIPPNDFIPLFEKNGLILELDRYVWECACKTLRKWLDEGKPPLPISVNVSRIHLYNPRLCETLMELVNAYGLPPGLLELELTESAYTENPKLLYETMQRLQTKGFVFLMDDFGSGYSSLNMLKDIPVDILKIDMDFLKNTDHAKQGRIILESTIQMAQRLNLQIIAEGVETKEQAMFLLGAGCNKAQGYYYSKPLPVEDFETLLFH